MQQFIHLSDLHVRWHKDASENVALRFIVEQLMKRFDKREKPTVVITGDVTDDGTEQQYAQATKLLEPLKGDGFPLLIVPGNHDCGPAGNIYTEAALKRFEQMILREFLGHKIEGHGEFFPHIVESGSIVYIGVDSVIANSDAAMHFASGEVGGPQRKLLRDGLNKYMETEPAKTVVTYFHHHPLDRHRVMQMDDAKEVMSILSGRTDFLLFGHDHDAESWRDYQGIDWMIASGKTTQTNRRGQYQFTEVSVSGKDQHAVATVSLKR